MPPPSPGSVRQRVETSATRFQSFLESVRSAHLRKIEGKILRSIGLVFEAQLPGAAVGSICKIQVDANTGAKGAIEAEVIGFNGNRAILMPFGEATGIHTDCRVSVKSNEAVVRVGDELLGRVLNGLGEPIDGKGPIRFGQSSKSELRSLYRPAIDALKRSVIDQPLDLGVRALNAALTCGRGQRLGFFAGSGVGKSVLLGMMARNTSADVNVIALIGERGREVREFIERDLGEEGLKRSVVIVSTSETSPLLRVRAAFLAATIAEWFRDEGKDSLLMMDSVTRFCMAQREIGLSLGEPPASKGYTPSVFSLLPKLLERAGRSEGSGSITGLYTVLVEGDDMDEPVADAARSILDGHIVLSRKLAARNHFPAIDILQSASRVMPSVTSAIHRKAAAQLREWMALYRDNEDLIQIGAYSKGTNPKLDQAIAIQDRINSLLRQDAGDRASFQDSVAMLQSIVAAGTAQA